MQLTSAELFVGLSGFTVNNSSFLVCLSPAGGACHSVARQKPEINTSNVLSLNEERRGRKFKLLDFSPLVVSFLEKNLGQVEFLYQFKKRRMWKIMALFPIYDSVLDRRQILKLRICWCASYKMCLK